MKIGLLVALFCSFALSVICQTDSLQMRRELLRQIIEKAAQQPAPFGPSHETRRNNLKIPKGLFPYQQDTPTAFPGLPGFNSPAQKTTPGNNPTARLNELCKDTSYSHLLGITNGLLYLQSVTKISDGILLSALMYDTTRVNPYWRTFGLLIKLDEAGEVTWIKQFEDKTPGQFSEYIMNKAFELSNHDIVCVGSLNNNGNSDVNNTVVYRLTSTGNIIWQNNLKSTIGIFNSPSGTFRIWVSNAIDGLNGDVILTGMTNSNLSSGKIQTVIRLNSSGQLVWDANYGNHGFDGSYRFGTEGLTSFIENGKIVMVGINHATNNPITGSGVNFLTLDYNTGNLLDKRFFRPDYVNDLDEALKGFSYYFNRCLRLSNGHILVYGKLNSDGSQLTTIADHFGVMEFDASYNLVDAYTISSPLLTNYYNDFIYFDESGKGAASLFEFIGAYDGNVYFTAFQNKQFLKQRKAEYRNVGMPGNNGFAFLKDNGYAYIQTYYESAPVGKSYIEFRKMHNSDTASKCLGKDTTFLNFLPWHVIEDPGLDYLLDPNEPNKILAYSQNISQTDTNTTNISNPCKQQNFCDTVKIHGNPVICGNATSIQFTAFKNSECGSIVQWNVDQSVVDSMHVQNDSTTRIWFKNTNYQGKLYAVVPPGACYTGAIDSVSLSIVRSQSKIDLGLDTFLCKQNAILLDAGNSFSNYIWQDGSTDHKFTVVQPGIYWVKADDFCGNHFIDSITVNPFDVSVDLGPDQEKCNSDTLKLHAPGGFINYQWSNNYNLSSITGQDVKINPLIDTAYYLKAEKFAGCFAYDTLRIHVKHSPPILMGPDKSFCQGDSAILDAGTGFDHYQWSNGITSQKLTVHTAGSYAVMGTTTEGCRSYDTLRILTVWPNPVVSLDHSNGMCYGDTRLLNAGNFSSYQWQDGSSSSSYLITGIGTYYVSVTDNNGCKGSDTAKVTQLYPLPANFLPLDTSICNYGSLTIKSSATFGSYLWNTSGVTNTISVRQPGIYWLQVTDANHCTGRDSILVSPKDCITGFYIPNAFTPHKDGHNDIFKPILGGAVKQYQFSIYNRWGQLIFMTKDLYMGWDGTVGGLQQDTNTFVWVCMYQFDGEPVQVKRGTVMLIH